MKFSLNWLKEKIEIKDTPEALAEKLTLAGLEVEGLDPIGEKLQSIITGKIEKISPHPDADKLVICQINLGNPERSQIVTGATNIKEGDIVPVSIPGAVLANGMKIKPAKLRGVDSHGMLCSETELGVAEEAEGIWILPQDTPVGIDFIAHAELKDTLLDIAILPNRGDCQSINGLAREIATILNQSKQTPSPQAHPNAQTHPKLVSGSHEPPAITITINSNACPLYAARIIKSIPKTNTPLWMIRKLQLAGIRPISFLVDITNYILLETGQPLHAFDLKKLSGNKIEIRNAKDTESINTLDGNTHKLTPETLIIADAAGPQAIAGVMGGKDTEVDTTTTDILLEAAAFLPAAVRKSELTHGLRTESAVRFEKGIDEAAVIDALNRATALILELAGGEAQDLQTAGESDATKQTLPYDLNKINSLLGTTIAEKEAESILARLGYKIEANKIQIPTWKTRSVHVWQDIADEIARIHGLDNITTTIPQDRIIQAKNTPEESLIKAAHNTLKVLGLSEIITFPMIGEGDFKKLGLSTKNAPKLTNPLTPEESIMRPSLLPSLLKVYLHNHHRQASNLKLYEIANVFPDPQTEHTQIAGLLTGHEFTQAKGLLQNLLSALVIQVSEFKKANVQVFHPGKSAELNIGDATIGSLGVLHPAILDGDNITEELIYFELNLPDLLTVPRKDIKYAPISTHPTTRRDIALLTSEELNYGEIEAIIQKEKAKTCKDYFLFDTYHSKELGENKKSLAIAFIYQANDRTLSDDEVNNAHQKLIDKLSATLPITIR